jgi:tRNA G18 (ribose-2'-O)-methylase SpoU
MAPGARHQGVIATVDATQRHLTLDDVLDTLDEPPFLLVLDGIQDPHNLGACLRVADAVGAHAVIAPKDRAVGLTQTAVKVASGAAETVPYITVTNLARTPARTEGARHLGHRHRCRGQRGSLPPAGRSPAPGCSAPKAKACAA